MATVNEKMTALADEIRELSGSNTTKSLDAMTSDVDAANTEIAEQAELIAQIVTALGGKAKGLLGDNEEPSDTTKVTASVTGVTAIVQSDKEGSVVYSAYNNSTGLIGTICDPLTFFQGPNNYRCVISETTILNVPIVILTSGESVRISGEVVSNLITSGTGYYIYELVSNN